MPFLKKLENLEKYLQSLFFVLYLKKLGGVCGKVKRNAKSRVAKA